MKEENLTEASDSCYNRRLYFEFKKMLNYLWTYFKDWCWFYVYIQGDEFHPKLNLNMEKCMKSPEEHKKEIKRISKERDRAHELDIKFNKKSL